MSFFNQIILKIDVFSPELITIFAPEISLFDFTVARFAFEAGARNSNLMLEMLAQLLDLNKCRQLGGVTKWRTFHTEILE